ncbi:hypothetical protein JL721_5978 [Aureococcus anophagefferens]|nr:hypothetical protein JL721_5978 [Aureococcus anophagefferens]
MEELFYGKKKAENMPSTPPPPSACDAEKKDYVLRELSKVYASVFRPVEEATNVGKTTFIEYLLGKSFPGERVGPEPTTDRFTAVMYGEDERTIPGNALTVAPNSPFRALQREGNNFLSRFEGSMCAPLLEHLTPSTRRACSPAKQRVARNYDFDVLDISDELMSVIKGFKGHEDKVRVVLNKADSVSQQQLMRVYGALMWSLGKVLNTPEMPSVYGFDKKKKELLDTMPAQFRTPGYQEAQAQLEAWQRQNASQLACGLARVWTVRTLDPSTRQLAAVIVKNLLAKGLALDDASLAELRGQRPRSAKRKPFESHGGSRRRSATATCSCARGGAPQRPRGGSARGRARRVLACVAELRRRGGLEAAELGGVAQFALGALRDDDAASRRGVRGAQRRQRARALEGDGLARQLLAASLPQLVPALLRAMRRTVQDVTDFKRDAALLRVDAVDRAPAPFHGNGPGSDDDDATDDEALLGGGDPSGAWSLRRASRTPWRRIPKAAAGHEATFLFGVAAACVDFAAAGGVGRAFTEKGNPGHPLRGSTSGPRGDDDPETDEPVDARLATDCGKFWLVVPSFFEMLAGLAMTLRNFSLVFRTYGSEAAKVVRVALAEGKHPFAGGVFLVRVPTMLAILDDTWFLARLQDAEQKKADLQKGGRLAVICRGRHSALDIKVDATKKPR